MPAQSDPPAWKILLAFAIIYFVWGSTFLAIRVGVREVPPFLYAIIGYGQIEWGRMAATSVVFLLPVVLFTFAVAGGLSAFGGILLAGYASKAAQAMGDAYLLPSIAAVVLGGASILGGRGKYIGTVAGVILITLLQSILSVIQMQETGRQIIYGVVIIAMLLLYGRERLAR